ncbi:carbohydrate-binding protein [Myxococcus dinghuensis]|uniref:carbohydrate-binding protein n=1 Tax=Myxococcus dinghuensis TaxID=2906761 RepID=UPI002B1F3E9B|nr:carbohydrate-binding protein [Myxococcus dinghuensis]
METRKGRGSRWGRGRARAWSGLVLAAVLRGGALARASEPEHVREWAFALAGKDRFGVAMLYPSRLGGESWTLTDAPLEDPRFDPRSVLTRNEDGSWKARDPELRMQVFTSEGYDASRITTYDREVLARRGYMQSPADWHNVEMTGFVRLNAATVMTDNFDWYARGGRHNTEAAGCEGSSYKAGLHYDGRVRWQKESWHVSYVHAPFLPAVSPLLGRWVGFKAVMRDVRVGGRTTVRMESYVNDNADQVTWRKVYDWVDAGAWGGDAGHCGGGVGAAPITWGGPIATFRWDNATDVDFKWLSVREIQPE